MIYLGADHGGYELKEKIKLWLKEQKIVFVDLGANTFDANDDYPQFAFNVAKKISSDPKSKGILICRSAAGMVIAANRLKNVRAVAVFDPKQAMHAREHNDANVIGISGDWTEENTAKELIYTFLNTSFSEEERHKRRLEQIERLGTSV